MPTLTIDDQQIEVSEGTKIIRAAEQLGIMIPRFCYHWILGSVGACRMCAVKLLHKEFKGVQMSCMLDAQDGMIVSTTHPEAVDFRRRVIEWLMLNHPHDCPVCDEGGHCLLQDETVSGGHGLRRYQGLKRTYPDQDLGPFVQHEMNRCIHCYRCVRLYQDFCGYRDLGAMQIADRVYFGRFADGPLESPFAGNLIDICPTGVYTDKPARYKLRRWHAQRAPSLCIHCSLVCSTIANAYLRRVLRQEARIDEIHDGNLICDRGRYGFPYTNLEDRPREPRVDGRKVARTQAIDTAANRLAQIAEKAGTKAVAVLGSVRSSLESLSALKHLCRTQQWPEPAFFPERDPAAKTRAVVEHLDESLVLSLRDIEQADFILAVGVDPLNEAPVLAPAMRQVWRRGGTIVVVDPRPISLPFDFHHLAVPAADLDLCVGALIRRAFDQEDLKKLDGDLRRFCEESDDGSRLDPGIRDRLAEWADPLQQSRNTALICGTDVVEEHHPARAADYARLCMALKGKAGIFYVLNGPNAFGAGMLNPSKRSLQEIIEGIERGRVRALMVVESDPFREFPDRNRFSAAIEKLDLLLVLDCLPSESVERSDVLVPTTTVFETPSTYVNQEGRLCFAYPVHVGGLPIEQVSGGGHPPRIFIDEVPGAEPLPAWQILMELNLALSPEAERLEPAEMISREHKLFSGFLERYPVENVRLLPAAPHMLSGTAQGRRRSLPERTLELLLVDRLYGTEELSGYSPLIRQVEAEPWLYLQTRDAVEVGVGAGDRIRLNLDGGTLEVRAKVFENMAPGTAVLPRDRRLIWQRFSSRKAVLPLDKIERI